MQSRNLHLVLALILSVFFVCDSRIIGRKLQSGEPCSTPGFFGSTEDCRIFYRCAEHPTEDENNPVLIRYTFRCPNGTVWDETLSTCNHPEAVMNKPENCQVYDPEEDSSMTGNEDGSSGSSGGSAGVFGGQFLITQPQYQHHPQTVFLPVNYPSFTVPYGNYIQYG